MGGNHSEDIVNFCNQGFEVDDDNELALENIPTGEELTSSSAGLKEGQKWEWGNIGHCLIIKPEKNGHVYKNNFTPIGVAFSEVILHFLSHTHSLLKLCLRIPAMPL